MLEVKEIFGVQHLTELLCRPMKMFADAGCPLSMKVLYCARKTMPKTAMHFMALNRQHMHHSAALHSQKD